MKRGRTCYSGKHTVIQRPYTSAGKCLGGKSTFVNDMGQPFRGPYVLVCRPPQSPLLEVFCSRLFRSCWSIQILLWVIKSSPLTEICLHFVRHVMVADIAGGKGSFNYLDAMQWKLFSLRCLATAAVVLRRVPRSLQAVSTAYWLMVIEHIWDASHSTFGCVCP